MFLQHSSLALIIHIYEKSMGKINGKDSSGTKMGFEVVVTCTVEPQSIRKDKGWLKRHCLLKLSWKRKSIYWAAPASLAKYFQCVQNQINPLISILMQGYNYSQYKMIAGCKFTGCLDAQDQIYQILGVQSRTNWGLTLEHCKTSFSSMSNPHFEEQQKSLL